MKPIALELYKCALLTVIAVLLGFILWRMAERSLIVRVQGGNIDVDNTVDVDVQNSTLDVDVQNTVDVSIE